MSENRVIWIGGMAAGVAILYLLTRGGNSETAIASPLRQSNFSAPKIQTRPIKIPELNLNDLDPSDYDSVDYTGVDGGITPACNCGDYKFEINFSTREEQAKYFYADKNVRPILESAGDPISAPLPRQVFGRQPTWSSWNFSDNVNIPSRFS